MNDEIKICNCALASMAGSDECCKNCCGNSGKPLPNLRELWDKHPAEKQDKIIRNVKHQIACIKKQELLSSLTCALTHDISVCEECKKCEGNSAAEIRINLMNKMKEMFGDE